MTTPKYFVVCKISADEGAPHGVLHSFATHRWFSTPEAAAKYAASVAPSREPIVVEAFKNFYDPEMVES